jgi:hypothetical protein
MILKKNDFLRGKGHFKNLKYDDIPKLANFIDAQKNFVKWKISKF